MKTKYKKSEFPIGSIDLILWMELNDRLLYIDLNWKRKVVHPSIITSMTIRTVKLYLQSGVIYEAILK